jgi:hypothetical protein
LRSLFCARSSAFTFPPAPLTPLSPPQTIRSLENALLDFAGCALVVSHDRYFLDTIATHILTFENDSKITLFQGNWGEYNEDRVARLGDDAPRRPTFAPLM